MPFYPKVTNKVMPYANAPSGKVIIGKYIPPFEPVSEGFGFLGVVMEDYSSGKLQCHICGGWYGVFNSHLKKHGLNSDEYRKKFGLSKSTALKSKAVRLRQSEVMVKMRKERGEKFRRRFKKGNVESANRKGKPKSMEHINKFGVCDLQVSDRIMKLNAKLGKTPTLIDLKCEYGGGLLFQIHKKYSSYVRICRELGLEPSVSNHNPKYSREYFIEKVLSNKPTIRIFTDNECRAMYKYFKGGIKELKEEAQKLKVSS